jgi:hypothetical protein
LLCIAGVDGLHWDHLLLVETPQTVDENVMNVRLARAIEKASAPSATVAAVWAGAAPYFSKRHSFDLLGKCDRVIARMPVVPGIGRAGHNKFDIAWSVNHHRPDIVAHVFSTELLRDYEPRRVEIDGRPVTFFARRESALVFGGRRISIDDAAKIHETYVREQRQRK